jgi:hypothetical protein
MNSPILYCLWTYNGTPYWKIKNSWELDGERADACTFQEITLITPADFAEMLFKLLTR